MASDRSQEPLYATNVIRCADPKDVTLFEVTASCVALLLEGLPAIIKEIHDQAGPWIS